MLVAAARADTVPQASFADLSLEELANIRITSVSKRPESLAAAPAAIFVITNEEIRRSGSTTLPEALRLASNLEVARVDARNYAITARGFNNPFENKLLVLIDGRTVYSPLFSGVYWDAQDVVLDDVDRIEVISGPGATLWGANAVNGVINIITRSAADTQGWLLNAGAGNRDKNGAVRYGGVAGDGIRYRVYGKYAASDDLSNEEGRSILTGWHRTQAGFRSDWTRDANTFTVQGDTYLGELHQGGTADIRIVGANLTARSTTRPAANSDLMLQVYWDFTGRDQPTAFREHLHTVDLQAQHSFKLAEGHDIVWGGGYRIALDRVRNGEAFAFLPGALNLYWADVFVQDEMTLPHDLRFTAGIKLENNNYTGTDVLPTLRLAWTPNDRQLVWSSLSRAARTPSRIDRDLYSPSNPRIVNGAPAYTIAGGPDFQSEIANVLELGYRARPFSRLSLSAALFGSRYDRLRTLEPGPGGAVFSNRASGSTRGLEFWGQWQVTDAWRLSGGGVVQKITTKVDADSRDFSGTTGLASADPSQHWLLRSSYDIAPRHEVDLTVRHSGRIDRPAVPSYTTLDLRYGWKVRRDLSLDLIGLDLVGPKHAEFAAGPGATVFERSFFVKLVWTP